MPTEQTVLRRQLASFVDVGVKLDGLAERFMDQIQNAVREARRVGVQLGATYTQTHDGVVWPAKARGPYAYTSLADFDRDLNELMRQYGFHELVDANGRTFKLHAVLAFDVQPYQPLEEHATLEAVDSAQ